MSVQHTINPVILYRFDILPWYHTNVILPRPFVLLQGTDVDACYDTTYWRSILNRYPSSSPYDSTYDVRYSRNLIRAQVEALLSDMCGWRMVSKRGYTGALKGATNTTLQVCVQLCTGKHLHKHKL
jgi:hypothetical protein